MTSRAQHAARLEAGVSEFSVEEANGVKPESAAASAQAGAEARVAAASSAGDAAEASARAVAARRELRSLLLGLEEVMRATQDVADVKSKEDEQSLFAERARQWQPEASDPREWSREPLADLNIGRTVVRERKQKKSKVCGSSVVSGEVVAVHCFASRSGALKREYKVVRTDGVEGAS